MIATKKEDYSRPVRCITFVDWLKMSNKKVVVKAWPHLRKGSILAIGVIVGIPKCEIHRMEWQERWLTDDGGSLNGEYEMKTVHNKWHCYSALLLLYLVYDTN